jgi:hypothetical protein
MDVSHPIGVVSKISKERNMPFFVVIGLEAVKVEEDIFTAGGEDFAYAFSISHFYKIYCDNVIYLKAAIPQ